MKKILIILSAVVLICVSSVIILCSRYPKTDKFENFDDLSFKGICLIAEDYAEKHLDGSCKLYGITANDVKKDKGIFEFIYTDRIGLFRHAYFVSVDLYSKKIACSAQWNAKRLYGRDIILEPQSWNFELYKIDDSILVYGEPWTGGTSALDSSKSATSAGLGTSGNGYGAFDDDFRDALKGAEFGGFNRGQIQGNYEDANLILGLSGKTIAKNSRNATGKTGLALHYVECHDNYTLFDKLVYSMDSTISGDGDWAVKFENLYNSVMKDESKVNLIKKENKLAAAYVFLSQGTPFINGGQEFMRTKKGSPDSYSADKKGGITWTNTDGKYNIDDVNTIDISLKEKYIDVYNTYKGLIHLRKDYDAFRKPSSATAKTLKSGVTLYEVNGSNGNFAVVFNATNNDESFDKIEGNLVTVDTKLSLAGSYFGLILDDVDVDVKPYVVSSQKAQFSSVPAKSFIIIKK